MCSVSKSSHVTWSEIIIRKKHKKTWGEHGWTIIITCRCCPIPEFLLYYLNQTFGKLKIWLVVSSTVRFPLIMTPIHTSLNKNQNLCKCYFIHIKLICSHFWEKGTKGNAATRRWVFPDLSWHIIPLSPIKYVLRNVMSPAFKDIQVVSVNLAITIFLVGAFEHESYFLPGIS